MAVALLLPLQHNHEAWNLVDQVELVCTGNQFLNFNLFMLLFAKSELLLNSTASFHHGDVLHRLGALAGHDLCKCSLFLHWHIINSDAPLPGPCLSDCNSVCNWLCQAVADESAATTIRTTRRRKGS